MDYLNINLTYCLNKVQLYVEGIKYIWERIL